MNLIQVCEHIAAGVELERKHRTMSCWVDADFSESGIIDAYNWEYRIKPQPREIWANTMKDYSLVANSASEALEMSKKYKGEFVHFIEVIEE